MAMWKQLISQQKWFTNTNYSAEEQLFIADLSDMHTSTFHVTRVVQNSTNPGLYMLLWGCYSHPFDCSSSAGFKSGSSLYRPRTFHINISDLQITHKPKRLYQVSLSHVCMIGWPRICCRSQNGNFNVHAVLVVQEYSPKPPMWQQTNNQNELFQSTSVLLKELAGGG